jgi:hypothetical protein
MVVTMNSAAGAGRGRPGEAGPKELVGNGGAALLVGSPRRESHMMAVSPRTLSWAIARSSIAPRSRSNSAS